MILAAKIGRPIDPDALWERFASEIERPNNQTGAVSVSMLLDMARDFGIARHLDVTHDVDRLGQALATADVAGALMTWERFPTQAGGTVFGPFHHVVVAHRVMVDTAGMRYIEAESAHEGETSEFVQISEHLLPHMMSSFLILYGHPKTNI